MSQITLMKMPGGYLVPCDDISKALVEKWRVGQGVHADVKKARNLAFHRKFFAMLNVGFDAWEPLHPEHRGLPVAKNFERFRKDVLIAAGYYEPVVNLRGDVRAEATSISFGSMDDDDFAEVYSKVADVLLQRVLTNYKREDLDRVVNELMGFV